MSKAKQERVCVCPCRRIFIPRRPSQTHYAPRCRASALRARRKKDPPPLVVRHVETVPAADLERELLEALRRRVEAGNSASEAKSILLRVANLIGTDQGRRADGTFTRSAWRK